ncbi:MAG TPA: diaminopropionate ammonia-lyase [Vicinamibacterales bacterium]|nr:diaminopropionate ammonia-lyase [Vicinamibacterales bacterium]
MNAHLPGWFALNLHPARGLRLDAADEECLGNGAAAQAGRLLSRLPRHAPTPLLSLAALARTLGVAALHLKDESGRHGLGSFKALGGGHAVLRLVAGVAGSGTGITMACATDGNHGRSVAAATAAVGARAVIFVHHGVSAARVAAITGLGAEIVRVRGTYDDAVAEASRQASANGWVLVSDTSWPGYERIPRLVMQGYTVLVREALAALSEPPTHVFVQAGVGGFAAAVAGHLGLALGLQRPKVIVVEPARAACLFASALAGRAVKIAPGEPTVMAMLECYEPSMVAWQVLSRAADAFMTVGEDGAVAAMRRLARPAGRDPAVVAGESGGAGLAGLLRVASDAAVRAAIRLDAESRVLLVNTEGATDPERYQRLVGADGVD